MATKLRNREEFESPYPAIDEPIPDPATEGALAFNIDSTAQVDIPTGLTPGFPVPQRIIVRQLDIVPGAPCPLGYVQPDRAHPCSSLADVVQMISNIRSNNYNYQSTAMPYYRPLDLNLDRPTCFVIRLSSGWPWRFSHKVKGLTLGIDIGAHRDNYCNLKHVLNDNVGQDDPFPHEEYCRLLYFFATPVAGTPVPSFHHSFNVNVEMVHFDGPGEERINTIPIVIDPDIRFPGGSGA